MRFPRRHSILHGRLDMAPFAAVLFVLVMFVALSRNLVLTPGVSIRLPEAVGLPGTPHPTVVVAVDESGQLYFENQITSENLLRRRLAEQVRASPRPLTLVIQADKNVRHETLVRLGLIARDAGVKEALLATRPPLAQALRKPQ